MWKEYLTRKLSVWLQDCPWDADSDLLSESRIQAEVAAANADKPVAVSIVCKAFDD